MRLIAHFLAILVLGVGLCPDAAALDVFLYTDSAPNVYGSPLYAPWRDAAFAAAAGGTFVNMLHSYNPANIGTTNFEIQDEVVYSFGDLGKRLHWIYWVPNSSIAALQTANFQIGLHNTWDGEWSDFYLDYYGSSWLTPTSWIEYEGGVIGTAGMAWWGAYNTNTQEELDADIAAWGLASEEWQFLTRWDGGETSITCYRDPIPEPSTLLLLLGGGMAGAATLVARRRSK